jgi:uncharacterized membrane protein
MTVNRPFLDRPASIPVVRRLLASGALATSEAVAVEGCIRRDLPWQSWLDRVLLGLGVTLILAGIGYFFAHNWDHLTDADKLVLAGGSVFVALAAATWAGFDRLLGKVLLLAASALVGVFLAVFGQVYQTGADAYELFAMWAVLIIPWVILARFVPLWIFWIALLNFALGYYLAVVPFFDLDNEEIMRQETLVLVFLNGGALLVREIAARRPPAWLDSGWSVMILLAATLIPASTRTIWDIFNTWDPSSAQTPAWVACLLYAILAAALAYHYSGMRYSLPALAIVTLSACTVLTCVALRVIDIDHEHGGATWFICGIVVLAIFGAGVFFLRSQRLAHQPHA